MYFYCSLKNKNSLLLNISFDVQRRGGTMAPGSPRPNSLLFSFQRHTITPLLADSQRLSLWSRSHRAVCSPYPSGIWIRLSVMRAMTRRSGRLLSRLRTVPFRTIVTRQDMTPMRAPLMRSLVDHRRPGDGPLPSACRSQRMTSFALKLPQSISANSSPSSLKLVSEKAKDGRSSWLVRIRSILGCLPRRKQLMTTESASLTSASWERIS
jgi:hypothetical protein